MAYKLIDAAQARWRAVNAPHLVALVRAGAVFHKGKLLERPVDITPDTSNAETEPQDRRSPETRSSTGLENISTSLMRQGGAVLIFEDRRLNYGCLSDGRGKSSHASLSFHFRSGELKGAQSVCCKTT
jgi:hypothetical protein